MATHSSVLAWRIPGTAEPGGLPSMGSHRVGHDWSNLAAAATEVMCVLKWKRKENMNESHVVSVTLCIWSWDVLKLFSIAFSSKRFMPKIIKWFKYRKKDTYSTSFNHCFSKLSSGWFPPPGPKGFSYLACLHFFCSISKIFNFFF